MCCPSCKNAIGYPGFTTHTYTMWANQYGVCERIFCEACNEVNDVTEIVGKPIKIERISLIWDGKYWQHAETGPTGTKGPPGDYARGAGPKPD